MRRFDSVPQQPLIPPVKNAHDEVRDAEHQSREEQRAVSRTRHRADGYVEPPPDAVCDREDKQEHEEPEIAERVRRGVCPHCGYQYEIERHYPKERDSDAHEAVSKELLLSLAVKRADEEVRRDEKEECHRKRGGHRFERADDEDVGEREWSGVARGPPLSGGNVRQARVDEDDGNDKEDLNVIKVVESWHHASST